MKKKLLIQKQKQELLGKQIAQQKVSRNFSVREPNCSLLIQETGSMTTIADVSINFSNS